MNCPHCNQEIIITLTAPEMDIRLRWKEQAQGLMREWNYWDRKKSSERANLDWLDGRMTLLKEIGISKYEALRLLKKEGNV